MRRQIEKKPRNGAYLSPKEQFDVGLVAVTSVLFLARHFSHDAQTFQHLDRCCRGRKTRVQLLANAQSTFLLWRSPQPP